MLCILACMGVLAPASAAAQVKVNAISLKSGENTEMGPVYWIKRGANCQSTLMKIKGVEVLEGPPEVSIKIREEAVLPTDCTKKVPGGIVVLSVNEVKAPVHGKLVYRINLKTKYGDRQQSFFYTIGSIRIMHPDGQRFAIQSAPH